MSMTRVLTALADAFVSAGESTEPPHRAFAHRYGLGRTYTGMPHTIRLG